MAKMAESVNQSQMQAMLATGYNTLDGDENITFTKYTRHILPVDGYVFWVKDTAAKPLIVKGSLHYSTDQEQREDETIGINRVILTTDQQIQDFNTISSSELYIGEYDSIRFAFTAHGKLYHAAGIFHYLGDAIYPAMFSQIIDSPTNPLNLGEPIATNSLPIWLSLNAIMPVYPAFMVSSNLRPPYAAVQIGEDDTTALQSAPYIDKTSAHWQLIKDKVKVTIYGLRNNDALDFQDYVNQQSIDTELFGITNVPVIRDAQRTQSELGILAIKKVIEFDVNYYQNRALSVARDLIKSAGCTISISA